MVDPKKEFSDVAYGDVPNVPEELIAHGECKSYPNSKPTNVPVHAPK